MPPNTDQTIPALALEARDLLKKRKRLTRAHYEALRDVSGIPDDQRAKMLAMAATLAAAAHRAGKRLSDWDRELLAQAHPGAVPATGAPTTAPGDLPPPTLTEITRALGVTRPTAVTIRARGLCGRPGERTESWWREVAASAIAAGLKAPGLVAMAARATGPATTAEPPRRVDPPRAETPPRTGDDMEENIALVAENMRTLGEYIRIALGTQQTAYGASLVGHFQKLSAEHRQLVAARDKRRLEMAELLQRDEAIAAASGIWLACRQLTDRLIGQLASPGCLPAWVAEVGGNIPETREALEKLRNRIEALVQSNTNNLADALARGLPEDGYNADAVAGSRAALAAELRAVADRLTRGQEGR